MEMVICDTMEFGTKLKTLMREHRYSQETLAKEVGVSQNLVSLWTRGKSLPDIREARALARAFGVSVDYLVDDDQDEPPAVATSERERMVWEVVRTIGAEDAWRILMAELAAKAAGKIALPTVIRDGQVIMKEGRPVADGEKRKGAG